ncbi:glycosyl-4,4'-diaponeurosporenoate acyltransferase CrtO family protein [Lutibacter citreus]|uniref:glycosyl-4,4'-diaponeurosporenoate acyltransferase CrtO family protein n=1 Tax=Lutibacter citreus TaxID=2138210 RepID=UPI000DBEA60A|nr:hypothetical protein [Lutibacter citreus]
MQYLKFSISISIISWIVGMIIHELIKNKPFYSNLSNLNFIKSKNLNKIIGIGFFKWIVKNTFFKYFNQKLKLKNKIELTKLNELRKEMTISEISHLIGFLFVTIFAVVKIINANYLFGLVIMIANILLNLYPSLLQQENKRRIDRIIKIFS